MERICAERAAALAEPRLAIRRGAAAKRAAARRVRQHVLALEPPFQHTWIERTCAVVGRGRPVPATASAFVSGHSACRKGSIACSYSAELCFYLRSASGERTGLGHVQERGAASAAAKPRARRAAPVRNPPLSWAIGVHASVSGEAAAAASALEVQSAFCNRHACTCYQANSGLRAL